MTKYTSCHLGLKTARRNLKEMQLAGKKKLPYSAQTWSDLSRNCVQLLVRCSMTNPQILNHNQVNAK